MIMGKEIYALGSRTNWFVFTQQKRCAECGKKFSCTPHHVYRMDNDLYCSWTCYRVRQKAEEAKIAEMERRAEEEAARREREREERRAAEKAAKEAEAAKASLNKRILEAADRVKLCIQSAREFERAYAATKDKQARKTAREKAKYWRKQQEIAEQKMYRLMMEEDG